MLQGKVFIDAQGRTKIGEFGLAALCYHIAPLVPSVTFTGFSRWMSPELFDLGPDGDVRPTLASDVWALACTMYEVSLIDFVPTSLSTGLQYCCL